nr:MAG TPA: hypothetical protein [Caudoviricetes sp.]
MRRMRCDRLRHRRSNRGSEPLRARRSGMG